VPSEKRRLPFFKRKLVVSKFITQGLKRSEIAAAMLVSHHTALVFVERMNPKLKANSRTRAVHEAPKQGLLRR
jgi:DNA-binding NarL/FixJ family response regulator